MFEKVNRHPSVSERRRFGAVILIGFLILGAAAAWRHHPAGARACAAIGLGIGGWALLLPRFARLPYLIWMMLGQCLGFVTSHIALTVIFYVVVVPVALVFKLMKRDVLRRRKPDADSYWHDHPAMDDPTSYRHLF